MKDGWGVSKNQRYHLDSLKIAIGKFLASGGSEQYSTKDPMRAWLIYVRCSEAALEKHKQFLRQLNQMGPPPTNNGKPYTSFFEMNESIWESVCNPTIEALRLSRGSTKTFGRV